MIAPSSERVTAWNAALAASPGALDLVVGASHISGEIPASLRGGRLLSNGPGWNVIGGVNLHPFDGHGYVRAFAFQPDGSVRLTARHVATPAYVREAASGRLEVRGLGTNVPGSLWRNLPTGPARNVANTTINRWGDRLFAGWEGGTPTALDPASLDTLGEETFDGALAGQATLAHFKHDAVRRRLVTCSVKMGRTLDLTFREVDPAGTVVSTVAARVDGVHFVHDFAVSPSWYVLGGNPLRLKPTELLRSLVGRSTLLRALDADASAPPALLLVPRAGGAVRQVRLPDAAWVVHFGAAFERDGDLIVDACVFHRLTFGEEFGYTGPDTPFDPTLPDVRGPQRLYRITVPRDGAEARWERLTDHAVDFPRFHPQHEGLDTPALFGATRVDTRFSDPFDAVIRVDLRDRERPPSLWSVGDETAFVGEPVFVPDAESPDAGHVLVVVSHGGAARTSLVVLDALHLSRGPLAVVPLPLLPVAFHGVWDA